MSKVFQITRFIVLLYFFIMGYVLYLKPDPPFLTFGYGLGDLFFIYLYGILIALYLIFSFKPYRSESKPVTLIFLIVTGYLLILITLVHIAIGTTSGRIT